MPTPCFAPEPAESYHSVCSVGTPKQVLTDLRRPRRYSWCAGDGHSEGAESLMSRQQERARRTRSTIVGAAAAEFAKRGYAAASINAILEHSNATKGAMYFHFASKEDLARAVLEEGLERYQVIVARWQDAPGLDPFERLHGLVADLGKALRDDVVIAAEFRLVTEPEFAQEARLRGSTVWGRAGHRLAVEAQELGLFRPGADPARFVEAVASSLAGQRYLADLTAPEVDAGERFELCLEVPLEAMASEEWLARWRRAGWPELSE